MNDRLHLVELPKKTPTMALKTQQEIAQSWGVSKGRVWQIETRALAKLKKAIQYEAAKRGVTVREWLYGER